MMLLLQAGARLVVFSLFSQGWVEIYGLWLLGLGLRAFQICLGV